MRAKTKNNRQQMTLALPWPPSVNHYWVSRVLRGRTGKSFVSIAVGKKGKTYRSQIPGLVPPNWKTSTARLSVSIHVHPPDKRKRDLDNLLKAPIDALTHAGVWADDCQIDSITIKRKTVIKGGNLVFHIRELNGKQLGLF